MHKAGALVVFACSALYRSAWADEATSAVPVAHALVAPGEQAVVATDAPQTNPAGSGKNARMYGGVAFLPMPFGKGDGYDIAFAYGVGVSLGYVVVRGLSVGVAPQLLFNIRHHSVDPSQQYDLMARIAYAVPVAARIAVYGEFLPGYSVISPPKGDSARGLVVAVGVGAAVDLADRVFANLGVGYQWGFQTIWVDGTQYYDRDKFLRIALGGGVKF